jgi:hypothetical protein
VANPIYIIKVKGPSLQSRDVETKVDVPKVNDTVLVALEMGTRRLPRCLGVIQSQDYNVPGEEE